MKQVTKTLTIALLLITTSILSQSIEGVKFENYPAKLSSTQKATLNLASNKLGKTYRTAIIEGYKNGKVDFGGHYISIYWGAGSGQSLGAIVDTNDGKIYELPLTVENSNRGADSNDNIKHKKESYLFVCYSSQTNDLDYSKMDLNYYFYKFDEKTKRFNLLSTKKKIVKKEED